MISIKTLKPLWWNIVCLPHVWGSVAHFVINSCYLSLLTLSDPCRHRHLDVSFIHGGSLDLLLLLLALSTLPALSTVSTRSLLDADHLDLCCGLLLREFVEDHRWETWLDTAVFVDRLLSLLLYSLELGVASQLLVESKSYTPLHTLADVVLRHVNDCLPNVLCCDKSHCVPFDNQWWYSHSVVKLVLDYFHQA